MQIKDIKNKKQCRKTVNTTRTKCQANFACTLLSRGQKVTMGR